MESEWISCKIQQPTKDGKPFLGFGMDVLNEDIEIITMIWYVGGKDQDGYESYAGFYALGLWGKYNNEHCCMPTHWMPIPKPPKE